MLDDALTLNANKDQHSCCTLCGKNNGIIFYLLTPLNS